MTPSTTREPAQPLVLASGSPRRRELLTRAGIGFEVIPADIPEYARPDESPREMAIRLAGEKALAVARRLGPEPPRPVLGADTIVVLGREVIGKPKDAEDAVGLLQRLLGHEHAVITGFALADSGTLAVESDAVTSRVAMRDASEEEIRDYVATGEPLDKAGAYAVQGLGARFVERVEGSRDNVIGLPVAEFVDLLSRLYPACVPGREAK
jgi:septum formation protein